MLCHWGHLIGSECLHLQSQVVQLFETEDEGTTNFFKYREAFTLCNIPEDLTDTSARKLN